MELEDFVSKLDGAHEQASGWSARCPAHDDRVSSLVVNTGRSGGIVLHCHAGCDSTAVVSALGLSMADLMGEPRIVAEYHYRDDYGTLLYTVERWVNPKTFRCRPGLPAPGQRVLYRADLCRQARETFAPIYVVEGEKDVDRLVGAGMLATCNVGGALKWLPHYAAQLAGCHVVVVADDDVPGRAHARAVAAAVAQTALTVALVVPRDAHDVSDLLDAGYGLEALVPLPERDHVISYRASQLTPARVRWAWESRFPLGKLVLIEGDPGDGKSILSIDLAARWTSGAPMPDGTRGIGPVSVILVSAEDDMEDTIAPRLIAAGARLDYVHLVPHGETPELPFTFASGLQGIEALAVEANVAVIIFDPLMAFIGGTTDSHNDASVRQALYPLMALAGRTGAVVVAIRHLNKATGGKAIYRGGGSIGFTGAARVTHLVQPDPRAPEVKVLATVKNNLARPAPSMRYRIHANNEGVPYIEWMGASELTAQELVDGPSYEQSEEKAEEKRVIRAKKREGMDYLLDLLENAGEPMSWKTIAEQGRVDGFTDHQLRDARAALGLIKVLGPGGARDVGWSLPGETSDGSRLPVCSPQGAPWSQGSFGPTNGQTGAVVIDGFAVEDPEEKLMAADLVCDVCGTRDAVGRFAEPWWVVRCPEHNPIDYHAGPSI